MLVMYIGAVGLLAVYTYIAIDVINLAYSTIYAVPDKVMRWIGGPQEHSMAAQMVQEVKGGVQQSTGSAAQGAQQTASSGPQMGMTGAPFSKLNELDFMKGKLDPTKGGGDGDGGGGGGGGSP